MKMDIEPMQPETASLVASADGVIQQTEVATSTNGGMKTRWIRTYFVRLREEGKFVCEVPKLRDRSAICGAAYSCTAISGTKFWLSI